MKGVTTYYGRPITELSREELLEALEISVEETMRVRETAASNLTFMREILTAGRRGTV